MFNIERIPYLLPTANDQALDRTKSAVSDYY